MRDIVDVILAIDCQVYSFEAGNVRHKHEWTVWEHVKLPDGRPILPGTDCGLGGRVHPQIAWVKLEILARGAELATQQLWREANTPWPYISNDKAKP